MAILRRSARLHVEVRDWGVGFESATGEKDGFGLRLLRERAKLLGAQLVIDSRPHGGARIVMEMPLIAESGAAAN